MTAVCELNHDRVEMLGWYAFVRRQTDFPIDLFAPRNDIEVVYTKHVFGFPTRTYSVLNIFFVIRSALQEMKCIDCIPESQVFFFVSSQLLTTFFVDRVGETNFDVIPPSPYHRTAHVFLATASAITCLVVPKSAAETQHDVLTEEFTTGLAEVESNEEKSPWIPSRSHGSPTMCSVGGIRRGAQIAALE